MTDTTEAVPSETKHYLFLLSLSQRNASVGKALLTRIQRMVDPHAAPLWVDGHGVGIFLSSDLSAYRVWGECLWHDSLTLDEKAVLKDALLVQVGPQFMGGGRAEGWLNSRFPRH